MPRQKPPKMGSHIFSKLHNNLLVIYYLKVIYFFPTTATIMAMSFQEVPAESNASEFTRNSSLQDILH